MESPAPQWDRRSRQAQAITAFERLEGADRIGLLWTFRRCCHSGRLPKARAEWCRRSGEGPFDDKRIEALTAVSDFTGVAGRIAARVAGRESVQGTLRLGATKSRSEDVEQERLAPRPAKAQFVRRHGMTGSKRAASLR